MQTRRILLSLTVGACVMTSVLANCFAQDDAKPSDKKNKQAAARAIKGTTARMMKLFTPANLTEEQKEQATAMIKKQVPKILAARKAKEALLTPEQKKARKAAVAKLKEQGVKGAKRVKGGIAAMELSDEELSQFNSANEKISKATQQIRRQITGLLSEEQLAAMPKRQRKPGKKDKATVVLTQTVSLKLPGMT